MSIFVANKEIAERKDIINPNLINNSATLNGFFNAYGDLPQIDDAKYQGLRVINQTNMQWRGSGPYMYVQKGTYTFSCYAKTSGLGVKSIMIPLNTGLDGKDKQPATVNTQAMAISSVSDWSRFDCTFVVSEAGYIHPRVESSGNNDVLLLAGFKLEKGSVATPWCPSINDLATGLLDIQAIKSKLGGVKLLYRIYYATSLKEVA
jgi:hypothetical protein